jgi:isopentenyl phosphate kinase
MNSRLYFLKLGGSLITDKQRPRTVLLEVLSRLAGEAAAALAAEPDLHLLMGHGSGSFGHVPAGKYGTRQGVSTPEQWRGFTEVWKEAAALNHYVMDALHAAGLPAVAFPPSAGLLGMDGKVAAWDLGPLQAALNAGLLPVVYGDVAFDQVRGGTIFSTEDLFDHLARQLKPQRLLLAGIQAGVWADYPACTRLIGEITPHTLDQIAPVLQGSAAPDVTGGMYSKVTEMLKLVQAVPGLEAFIFSGVQPGNVSKALMGERIGTRLLSDVR